MSSGSDRRRGWLAVAAGTVLVLAIQIAAPVRVPLYDGVVVQEPYRYLHPIGDQAGDPTSGSDTEPVVGGAAPILVVSTSENPAQAQLIAQLGAFELHVGANSLMGIVQPIEPPPAPAGGIIIGNVYAFTVADQAGNAVAPATCDGCRSLILRAPDANVDATIKRYANGAWTDLKTTPANLVGFQVEPTLLGDFALIAVGDGGTPTGPADTGSGGGLSPIVIVGGAVLALLLAVGLFLFVRVRQASAGAAPGRGSRDGPTNRIPSKRKPPRRPPPPPGRSNR